MNNDLTAFEVKHLSQYEWQELRNIMLADSYAFASIACGLGAGGVHRFHAPLTYLYTGQTALLVQLLDNPNYDSEITRRVKLEAHRRGIDYNTPAGFRELDTVLRHGVNCRISRSMGKTEYGKAALLWMATKDPNIDIGICSKSSPAAQEICESIGKMVMSERYRRFFPERIPEGKIYEQLTKSFINLGGRTSTLQHTIMAKGLKEQWTGLHFNVRYGDDMVGTESGDASIEDAHKWLAAREAIGKAEPLGGSRDVFVGTIYGPNDDHSSLSSDQSIFSIVVPIWTREVPADLDTMYTDGEPVLPEWYPLEEIRMKRSKTLAVKSSGEGEISWLQNFEMTAHLDVTAVFNEGMLTNAEFKWVLDEEDNRYLAHPRKESDVKLSDSLTKFNRDQWVVRHPKTDLDLAMGVDQSFGDSDASDRWCIFLAGQGRDGQRYLIDAIAGKGYEKMVEWIPMKWQEWGRPRTIGVDANAQQAYSLEWMKRDERFALLSSYLTPVKSAQISKAQRIRNYLAAGFRSGELKLAPDLRIFREEALKWRPGMKGAGVDDIIDAAAIALEALDSYTYNEEDQDQEMRKFAASHAQNYDAWGVNVADWSDALL